MQVVINCNGEGFPDYPTNVNIQDVHVYMHDSGMMCTHDYACPVCRENHAVLDLSTGLMQPCRKCEELGYKIVKIDKKSLLYKIKRFFL